MTTTLRIDDDLKRDCDSVLGDLGLSLSGAVTIFLRQVVRQRAIPFVISCDRLPPTASDVSSLPSRGGRARAYAAEMRETCPREWSMDEIDAEIAAARRERHARASSKA